MHNHSLAELRDGNNNVSKTIAVQIGRSVQSQRRRELAKHLDTVEASFGQFGDRREVGFAEEHKHAFRRGDRDRNVLKPIAVEVTRDPALLDACLVAGEPNHKPIRSVEHCRVEQRLALAAKDYKLVIPA